MTTPRFTNCRSQKNLDKCRMFRHLHVGICHVLLHCPAIPFELPGPSTTRLLDSTLSHWWPILQRRTQLRHRSALGPSACVMQAYCPTKLARMRHVGRRLFQVFMSTILADRVPAKYRADRFSRVHVNRTPSHVTFSRVCPHS